MHLVPNSDVKQNGNGHASFGVVFDACFLRIIGSPLPFPLYVLGYILFRFLIAFSFCMNSINLNTVLRRDYLLVK